VARDDRRRAAGAACRRARRARVGRARPAVLDVAMAPPLPAPNSSCVGAPQPANTSPVETETTATNARPRRALRTRTGVPTGGHAPREAAANRNPSHCRRTVSPLTRREPRGDHGRGVRKTTVTAEASNIHTGAIDGLCREEAAARWRWGTGAARLQLPPSTDPKVESARCTLSIADNGASPLQTREAGEVPRPCRMTTIDRREARIPKLQNPRGRRRRAPGQSRATGRRAPAPSAVLSASSSGCGHGLS
jgi:hypothetical protein